MTNQSTPAVVGRLETPVRPRAWWRLSIYAECWPCVTVDEKEAEFWRSEGLTVVELGDLAAERERCTKKAAEVAIACTSMYADKASRAVCEQIAHEIAKALL